MRCSGSWPRRSAVASTSVRRVARAADPAHRHEGVQRPVRRQHARRSQRARPRDVPDPATRANVCAVWSPTCCNWRVRRSCADRWAARPPPPGHPERRVQRLPPRPTGDTGPLRREIDGHQPRRRGNRPRLGVDPNEAKKIFLPFYRPETSRGRDGRGGAGLASRSRARSSNSTAGGITVEPTPGGGATFVVTVPLADD